MAKVESKIESYFMTCTEKQSLLAKSSGNQMFPFSQEM